MHVVASDASYPVHVGADGAGRLSRAVAGRRVVPVASRSSVQHCGRLLAGADHVEPFVVADGEPAKSLAVVEELLVWFAHQRVTSGDVVVAVGGGALCDLVGFSSAVWRRGVPWIVVPTTVACAVDAGIGGKTAVNTAAGKNTAGCLWNPNAVVVDTASFDTLPAEVVADGLAEVVKVGCSHRPELIDRLLAGPGAVPGRWLDPVVSSAAGVAVEVASGRFGPGDNPDVLSVGHEIAHALETVSGFGGGHGAAVAVGLRFVHLLLAPEMYRVDPVVLDRVLTHCGLPLSAAAAGVDVPWESIRAELEHDKRMAGRLRFLVPLKSGTAWSADVGEAAAVDIWERLVRR